MRVLHVISSLPKAAGTSVFCAEACEHLQALGVECCIGVQRKKADDYPLVPAVPVIEIKSDFSGLPYVPDLVHLHALWNPFLHQVARWARRNNIPLVYSPHGMLTPWALGQKRLKKWLALALYQYWDLRSAKLIHVTADSELADVRRLGLNQPVVVAPLGVKVPAEAPLVRRNNPKIALFVSRVHPKKGLCNLVDAWGKVKNSSKVLKFESSKMERSEVGDQRSHDASLITNELMNYRTNELIPWKFIIAGPDQDGHAEEVMERARAAGVGGDFEMMGPVFGKQKDDLYAKADLFVLPSYSENFGVVVIEALAHGCPVITTKGTPWAELLGNSDSSKVLKFESSKVGKTETGDRRFEVRDQGSVDSDNDSANEPTRTGRAGWWIDIGVEPLVEALRDAMTLSDDERRVLGESGRWLVEGKYTWPAVAKEIKSGYEWVLNGGDQPDCVNIP